MVHLIWVEWVIKNVRCQMLDVRQSDVRKYKSRFERGGTYFKIIKSETMSNNSFVTNFMKWLQAIKEKYFKNNRDDFDNPYLIF